MGQANTTSSTSTEVTRNAYLQSRSFRERESVFFYQDNLSEQSSEGYKSLDDFNPGLRFEENLYGRLSKKILGGSRKPQRCFLKLIISSQNIEKLIKMNIRHKASVEGSISCNLFSPAAITITKGSMYMRKTEHYTLYYKLLFSNTEGKTYYLIGEKTILQHVYGDSGVTHRTPLNVTVYKTEKQNKKGKIVATGSFKMKLEDIAKQIFTLEITNFGHQLHPSLALFWKEKIGRWFAPSLWEAYSGIATSQQLFLTLPSRAKRPLKIDGSIPIPYRVITQDHILLRLKRYMGGSRGPVLLVHDIGVSSNIFSLDTIETNLVEHLFERQYDVWLLDWRASSNLQYSQFQFGLQEAAKFDIPAAVDKILQEVDKANSVQIVGQGIGSVIVLLSLLSGNLKTQKVRSFVSSQVATSFVAPDVPSSLNAGLYTEEMINKLQEHEISVDTSLNANWFDQLMQKSNEMWIDTTKPYKDCGSSVCHRIIFMYGFVMLHENINLQTHSSLHELFGYSHGSIFKEISACFKKSFLIRPEVLFKLKHYLNLPICFIHSEANACYGKQSSFATYSLLLDAYPEQNYEHHLVHKYGHMDCIIGKNAVQDVYPIISNSLDQYNISKDRLVAKKSHELTASEENGYLSEPETSYDDREEKAEVVRTVPTPEASNEVFCAS